MMNVIESVLIALGLFPGIELADSMAKSKTLTIMVIVGLVLFGGFVLFLFHMAGKQ
ncbi:hypothetical protein [Thalassomonas haliotis]|uniref:Uncharacterized protein n=1 Tax=Thalassomonas haliotis TaxID=485448 RepID=A0ABY7VJ73_9GAMM|nr:hypothetical protein [Thalassomonas haliotis]WDE12983.1 hypothetical protein H3N35_05870 [Thalassomonas haliotis]